MMGIMKGYGEETGTEAADKSFYGMNPLRYIVHQHRLADFYRKNLPSLSEDAELAEKCGDLMIFSMDRLEGAQTVGDVITGLGKARNRRYLKDVKKKGWYDVYEQLKAGMKQEVGAHEKGENWA
jgi:hypothetical protein